MKRPFQSLMRGLGRAMGSLAKDASPAEKVDRQEVGRRTEESVSDDGRVILRRTTIDEVEVRRDGPRPSETPET